MVSFKDKIYTPNPENVKIYAKLFGLYRKLHDAFGGICNPPLGSLMKELLSIKEGALK